VHDLQAGMNAAIGPPCRSRGYRRAGDGSEPGFERILDRAAAGLGLPAEEATAVVLQS
jgi:hypothetical protein